MQLLRNAMLSVWSFESLLLVCYSDFGLPEPFQLAFSGQKRFLRHHNLRITRMIGSLMTLLK